MRIFDPVIEGLGSAINLYQARHRVLAENIANVDTPGYRARDLDFASALEHAFEPSPATGNANEGPEAVVDSHASVKVDGNSVELDTEMSRLSENAFKIVALARLLARKYGSLRAAIQEGKS
jgi:flagellar basal-body rod protein FlgB